jgi:hypothetical protein
MECGASHFLIDCIARYLARQGLDMFNLGAADGGGLARFKSGLASTIVELEAASFFFGSSLRKKLIRVLGRIRS